MNQQTMYSPPGLAVTNTPGRAAVPGIATLLEAAVLLRRRVPSLMIAVMTALAVGGLIMTVGKSVAVANTLISSVDDAGARQISVIDLKAQGFMTPTRANAVRETAGVNSVVLTSLATDYSDSRVEGRRVPTWFSDRGFLDVIELQDGRLPHPEEAMISVQAQEQLGWDQPTGALRRADADYPVVGSYRVKPGWEKYATGAVITAAPQTAANPEPTVFTRADIMVDTAHHVPVLTPIIRKTLAGGTSQDDVKLTVPKALADIRTNVASAIGAYGQTLFWSVLTAGGLVVAGITLAETIALRRDMGRRRVLGATKTQVLIIFLLRVLMVSSAGAVLGVIASNATLGSAAPSWHFSLGTAALAVVAATLASAIPVSIAIQADPVRVLRTE